MKKDQFLGILEAGIVDNFPVIRKNFGKFVFSNLRQVLGKFSFQSCKELLDIDGENYYRIEAVFDNDNNKSGKLFYGITVAHPDTIEKWSDYFIIITTSRYVMAVEKQLESYGLVYKNDFIKYTDLYKNI